MKKMETQVLVAWLDPQPDREKGATYSCVCSVRPIKNAQSLIGRLTMQNYRFNWAYVFDETDTEEVWTQLHNELIKGLK